MTPLLTIIIPTYNSINTLCRALDSILDQTFTDYEILFIDNCSTDGTLDIIKNHASLKDNIRWISEHDKGIFDAMNKGIKLAKGEWIYFLGSDDKLFNSDVLQLIEHEVSNNNYDVIYGDVYSKRFNGRYSGEFTNSKILKQNICHQAIFFRKTIFKKLGLFSLKYKSNADWDHNIRWFLSRSISKKYFSLVVAEYADNGFSSTYNDAKFKNEKILQFLKYGKNQLSLRIRARFLKQELARTANIRNMRLFFKLVINTPKILIGI